MTGSPRPTFDPKDFFLLGQQLLHAAAKESEFRTVVGRAYYACLLSARDQLFDIDGRLISSRIQKRLAPKSRSKKSLGSHDLVIQAVASHPRIATGRQIRLSDQLSQLKGMRVQADYHMSYAANAKAFGKYAVSGWAGLAQAAMTLASNLLPDLQKLPRFRP